MVGRAVGRGVGNADSEDIEGIGNSTDNVVVVVGTVVEWLFLAWIS